MENVLKSIDAKIKFYESECVRYTAIASNATVDATKTSYLQECMWLNGVIKGLLLSKEFINDEIKRMKKRKGNGGV